MLFHLFVLFYFSKSISSISFRLQLQVPWSGSGLEDIKLAIQQLTMRSHKSSSTYSSLSGSESSEPAVRRLMRHSSLETINTNVTSADEFVWVDSHNRLVELQQLPWTHHDVLRVLQNGRTREHMEQVSMETIPRLSYLLQRALVRIGRETQRLAKPIGLCSKHEVYSAFKIVLCPALADSCTKVHRIICSCIISNNNILCITNILITGAIYSNN